MKVMNDVNGCFFFNVSNRNYPIVQTYTRHLDVTYVKLEEWNNLHLEDLLLEPFIYYWSRLW